MFTSSNGAVGPGIDLTAGYRKRDVFWGVGGTVGWSHGSWQSWSVFGEVRRRSEEDQRLFGTAIKYRWLGGFRAGYVRVQTAPGFTSGGPQGTMLVGQEFLLGGPVGLHLAVDFGARLVEGKVTVVGGGLLGLTTRVPLAGGG